MPADASSGWKIGIGSDGLLTLDSEPLAGAALAQAVYTLTQFPGRQTVVVNGTKYTRNDFEDVTPAILVELPLPFERVAGKLRLAGSSNTFEATFQYELADSSGTVLAKHFVTATSGNGRPWHVRRHDPVHRRRRAGRHARRLREQRRDGKTRTRGRHSTDAPTLIRTADWCGESRRTCGALERRPLEDRDRRVDLLRRGLLLPRDAVGTVKLAGRRHGLGRDGPGAVDPQARQTSRRGRPRRCWSRAAADRRLARASAGRSARRGRLRHVPGIDLIRSPLDPAAEGMRLQGPPLGAHPVRDARGRPEARKRVQPVLDAVAG